MRRKLLLLILALIILSGCGFPQLELGKKVIEHPAPDLKVDYTYFESLGCFPDPACLPAELQEIEHPVEYISEPGNILGGLSPAFPLAIASRRGFQPEDEIPAVHVNRCLADQYIRFLVLVDDRIRLVDSVEALAALYAPIESENEALSFAVAATGYSAVYDLDQPPKPRLHAEVVEETHVKTTADGYLVHLFDTYLCGCGPHIVPSVDVTVGRDGSISIGKPVEAFSDPKLDDLCVD